MTQIFGLGNAIVDVEVDVEDSFLTDQDLPKGQMTLVDSNQVSALTTALDGLIMQRCSGGSAANTIFAAQGFGLQTSYTCKVADDVNGRYFLDEMGAAGIGLNPSCLSTEAGASSGQCLVMISDDAERTMCTDLGISASLSASDLHEQAIAVAEIFYVEGYLSSSENATEAAQLAHTIAQANRVRTAVSLSDISMVTIFKDNLQRILGNGVHTLFCNEEEALAWAKTDRLDVAISELKDIAQEVFVTIGARGSVVIDEHGQQQDSPGLDVTPVDTNGAGDIYAGACLAARCQGADALDAAKFANHAAAHLITQYGARLKTLQAYADLKSAYA
ncbi:MAG TPA: adenosine kinase [Gammaproteobacteria bacterium]|nr:adenosine kinase [Gammaproteobacteria bacterium]|tara:strand:- start:2037 stop:3032 length:996 start_codon:yes stop_codon:yes gene_type:complete